MFVSLEWLSHAESSRGSRGETLEKNIVFARETCTSPLPTSTLCYRYRWVNHWAVPIFFSVFLPLQSVISTFRWTAITVGQLAVSAILVTLNELGKLNYFSAEFLGIRHSNLDYFSSGKLSPLLSGLLKHVLFLVDSRFANRVSDRSFLRTDLIPPADLQFLPLAIALGSVLLTFWLFFWLFPFLRGCWIPSDALVSPRPEPSMVVVLFGFTYNAIGHLGCCVLRLIGYWRCLIASLLYNKMGQLNLLPVKKSAKPWQVHDEVKA
jgi:hypothetical protein